MSGLTARMSISPRLMRLTAVGLMGLKRRSIFDEAGKADVVEAAGVDGGNHLDGHRHAHDVAVRRMIAERLLQGRRRARWHRLWTSASRR